jgi:hypothetical protein
LLSFLKYTLALKYLKEWNSNLKTILWKRKKIFFVLLLRKPSNLNIYKDSKNIIILGQRFFYQRAFTIDKINNVIFMARANCSSEVFGKGFDNSYIYKMGIYTILTICIVVGFAIIVVCLLIREYER